MLIVRLQPELHPKVKIGLLAIPRAFPKSWFANRPICLHVGGEEFKLKEESEAECECVRLWATYRGPGLLPM